MSDMVIWNPGTIIFPLADSILRLYQPHYRRNILVHSDAMPWINAAVNAGEGGLDATVLAEQWNEKSWGIKDATEFTLYDHAYANSAMFEENARIEEQDTLTGVETVELFVDAGILASSWPIVYDHNKRHFADTSRGSFYEQIGTACLLNRRLPTDWWTDQKFQPDRKSTHPNAYHYIQDRFLDGFLEEHVSGKTILEVGCGTGYYTNRMAKVAQKAVGVDYNPEYIEIANSTWQKDGEPNAVYGVLDIIDFSTNEPELVRDPYDYVILIDTFLFLFHESYQPELFNNRQAVLNNLAKLVKEDGRILIMDPHPLFLTPFFGDPNRPFGIVENYNTHIFRTAPTLAEITELLDKSRLAITRIIEPKPHPDFASVNPVSHKFYSEVPPWHLMEIVPIR